MKKDNIYSSAGTEVESSTNVHDLQVRQPTANEMLAEVPGGLNTLSKLIFNRNRIKWNYPEKRNRYGSIVFPLLIAVRQPCFLQCTCWLPFFVKYDKRY